MSVENIKAFSIIGLAGYLDDVVMKLGKSKVFQPDEVTNFYSNTRGFTRPSGSNAYAEPLAQMTNAMKTLGITPRYVKTKKKFNPKPKALINYAARVFDETTELFQKKTEAKNKLNECKRAIEETSHFVTVDHNIEELLNMKYVEAVFGRLPKENLGKLEDQERKNALVEFVPCTEEGTYVWGVYFAPMEYAEKADMIFSRLYFERSSFGDMNINPARKMEHLNSELFKLENGLAEIEKRIEDYKAENSDKILKYYTKISEYSLYHSIKSKAMLSKRNFCITGWVPEKQAKKLKQTLQQIESVEVSVANGRDELQLSPPVKLKNSFLTRPFQYYTEMYGVPKYKEMDPTPFVAFTYILLFGIMFGDVGHGFCVMVAGLLMWFLKKMPIGKILVPCGISGMIFGALFGSVFGFEDAMDWLYVDILGMKSKPIEVMSAELTNTILYVAVGLGMLLLCLAMMLNVYSSLKQGNLGRALFDTGGLCGLIFYGMLCAGIAGMVVFGVNLFTVPYILVIGASFILIFFREPLGGLVNRKENWKPESWGGFITENIFESIEVLLSYVTNTMSFLRVAAFVLVHAGMMQVVFTLANMMSGVGYVVILIFGNALVCVLEALLVSIQVLRLEYYEMFSRFYSGEGRPYEPVRLNLTKN